MAETTGLLNRRTSQAYHEFESRPLRAMQSARQTPHESAAFRVSGSFGKLAFQSSRACEKGPLGPSAVADCSRTHRDVRGPRPSKSRPTSPQPDIHYPTQCGLHPILPQVVWEGQPKKPRLPSRCASAPHLWPESWDGDFRVGNISVVRG